MVPQAKLRKRDNKYAPLHYYEKYNLITCRVIVRRSTVAVSATARTRPPPETTLTTTATITVTAV